MNQTHNSSGRRSFALEALEERRLLAGEPWGPSPQLIGQDQAAGQYPAVTGAAISVAVIDTGIDYLHPNLGGGFGPGKKVVAGYDFVDDDADPMDTDGHGTGVAGVIAASSFVFQGAKYQGVAPAVNLIALRTDPGNFGWAKLAPKLEAALQWVIQHRDQYNIAVVNMSIGTRPGSLDQSTVSIADELAALEQLGVVLVAASGNNQNNPFGALDYPASDENVLAVGSVNGTDVISPFTRRNEMLDLLAPGENVPTLYYLPAEQRHITLAATGTSFAAPFVSGAAALLKQIDSALTADEILSILQRGGTPNFDGDAESPSSGLTFPRINIVGAITLAMTERDDDYEGNDSRQVATPLQFQGDVAAVENLKLLLGDADYFQFNLDAYADVTFGIATSSGATAPGFSLLDAGGAVIKNLAANEVVRLAAGSYYLRVNAPASTLAGTYGLSLSRIADDHHNNHDLAGAIVVPLALSGESLEGRVEGAKLLGGLDDYWRFTLNASSDLTLEIQSNGTFVPAGQLLNAGGSVIAGIDGLLETRLAAGTYYVRVGSAVTLDGAYNLSISAAEVEVPIPGQNGSSNGIVYGPGGILHFAWFDTQTKNLKYAARDAAGHWGQVVVVDSAFNAGQFLSVAIDPQGRPGVAYYNASQGDLMYAHWDGASWAVDTVDSRFTTGYYPSLAYDGAGTPVISYYYKNAGDLRLAAFDGASGEWAITFVDTPGDVGRYSSLALSPATGRWAIAYEDSTRGHFKFAEQLASGAWKTLTVDSSTQKGGGYTSLAFDRQNRPLFSYYDARNADLKLAAFDGSRWNVQAVAGKNTVGLYSNLHVREDGMLDVLYFHKGFDKVMRATSATPKAGTWSLTPVTQQGGRSLSRAFDQDGMETLAFQDQSTLAILDL